MKLSFAEETHRLNRSLVLAAYSEGNGNITNAAKVIGVSRAHFYGLMKRHTPELISPAMEVPDPVKRWAKENAQFTIPRSLEAGRG